MEHPDNIYVRHLDDGWYVIGADHLMGTICDIKTRSQTAPWTDDNIRQLGSRSPSRDAAVRKAHRWGFYVCCI